MIARRRIGPLDVLEAAGESGGPAIVLFHGYGANAYDLASLAQVVRAPRGTSWYFPDGILDFAAAQGARLPLEQHPRAWWEIDHAAVEQARATGQLRDLSGITPPGLFAARDTAREFLNALCAESGRAPGQVTLGGFSQGAMLATELALTADTTPGGLVILSGTLLNQTRWAELAGNKRLQFFQSHGTRDPLLPFGMAERLAHTLREAGLSGEFVRFDGGHEIPGPVLTRLAAYLNR